MTKQWRIQVAFLLVAAILACGRCAYAQQPGPESASKPNMAPGLSSPEQGRQTKATFRDEHRFWDKTNDWLFAGVAASRTLDYFSTLNMRRRGRQEILLSNDAVDNHAAFGAIEAAGVGASIGASYLFHRYGHHKLERWVSVVHIGLATAGSVRNYCLQTFHTVPAQATP
jgi:hypothetical protein